MAVYTELGAQALADIIAAYDVGTLVSAKGIAEGVSNSNWLIETTGTVRGTGRTAAADPADRAGTRFILTVYEQRTDVADLPFFLGLLDHLAVRGCPVPRTIHDRTGAAYRLHAGKALALIEFLPGVSLDRPTAAQARAVGGALAQVHLAAADFPLHRANSFGPAGWRTLAEACGNGGLDAIAPGLAHEVSGTLARLAADWPHDLPRSVIHADLFPDNVLMIGDRVGGLIDFYFACQDITAYDIAVTHAAWCFDAEGRALDAGLSGALLTGYETVRPLSTAERAALPLLAQGAAMRFLMTRAYDWANTPADALVMRKDPLAFARRLAFYADPANARVFAP